MASPAEENDDGEEERTVEPGGRGQQRAAPGAFSKLLASYVGLAFALFLASLPNSSLSLISNLESRNRELLRRLVQTEEQLAQLKSRRREDFKANARVVEIFAGHRNAWQQEERKLLEQIEASAEETAHLRAKLQSAEKFEIAHKGRAGGPGREVGEKEEMLDFLSRKTRGYEDYDFVSDPPVTESGVGSRDLGIDCGGGRFRVSECLNTAVECYYERGRNVESGGALYGLNRCLSPDFLPLPQSRPWAERAGHWQDDRYEPLESMYRTKHFGARRETPWKVDAECGIAAKLKLLEHELQNMETVGKSDESKVPSFLRKQAKRYLALVGKIDGLCKRMQVSNPCEQTLGLDVRTKQHTEFLLEAFRLQQRACETGLKLSALQMQITETCKCCHLSGKPGLWLAGLSLHSIKNSFLGIQRSLEIWLARIIGDLEGVLARDGASRLSEYYIPRYPFVHSFNHPSASVFES